jgi:hypothetical protein
LLADAVTIGGNADQEIRWRSGEEAAERIAGDVDLPCVANPARCRPRSVDDHHYLGGLRRSGTKGRACAENGQKC